MDSPGHNVTGVWQAGYPKESLELLKRLMPEAEKFAILACDSETSRPRVKQIKILARKGKLPLKIVDVVVTNSFSNFKSRVLELIPKVDAFFILIPETIEADERKLKQILYNLLSNAIKFTPDAGHILLAGKRVSNADMQVQGLAVSDKNYIQISVEDSGIGLKKEDLERIFQPFEQVDSSASRLFQGTGLGLSLTKSLVELHGGKIWVASEGEGKGTTFFFCIPT